jgi:peroxiredoxin
VLSVACATTGAGSNSGSAHPPAAPAASSGGSVAEDFSLRDVDGKTVSLSDFAGKVVLIDFWATWCVPCNAELPHLEQLYETYKDKGFVVLAVSMDGPETIASVPGFARRNGMTFPVLLDEETRVTASLNPKRSAPLSILIDQKSRVVRTREGYSAGDENLIEKDVKDALAR